MNLIESLMKNTISAYSRKTVIRLFVYGTLKRGGWNHDRFCRNAVTIETATTEYLAWVYSMQVAPGGKRLRGEWLADFNARKI